MSVNALPASNSSAYGVQTAQSSASQVQQEFQKLGKDLASGDLGAAQKDFVTLRSDVAQASSTGSASSTSSTAAASTLSSIAQTFTQLGKDLSSGNLKAAQNDFHSLQQDLRASAGGSQVASKGHHHHHGGGGGAVETDTTTTADSTTTTASSSDQLLAQLGSSISSGDVASAQKSFSALEQNFTAAAANSATASGGTTGTLFQAVV